MKLYYCSMNLYNGAITPKYGSIVLRNPHITASKTIKSAVLKMALSNGNFRPYWNWAKDAKLHCNEPLKLYAKEQTLITEIVYGRMDLLNANAFVYELPAQDFNEYINPPKPFTDYYYCCKAVAPISVIKFDNAAELLFDFNISVTRSNSRTLEKNKKIQVDVNSPNIIMRGYSYFELPITDICIGDTIVLNDNTEHIVIGRLYKENSVVIKCENILE